MATPRKLNRDARKRLIVSLGDNLDLDVELAARQNLAVVANSGGGKTKALRLLIEALIPHMAVVVFDTAGEFWTLCEHFECLLVGPNGQLPADPEIAADLARFIREKALRVVVDLSRLEEEDQQLFVERFINALLKLPDTMWGTPIAVVIDEVHLFAPQEERPGSRKSVGNLTTLGRKQGIFSIVATQSLAETSKKILGSINNRLYGRFAEEPDLMRASRALGFKGRKEWATIESFEPGDFYAKGAAWISAKPIVRGHTNNKTISTHIDQSTHITSRPPPASASVRALATELAKKRDEIAAAKAVESQEIDVLRKRIRELEGGDEVRRLRSRVAELERTASAPAPTPDATRRGRGSMVSNDPVDQRAIQRQTVLAVGHALSAALEPVLSQISAALAVVQEIHEAERALDAARATVSSKLKALGAHLTKMQSGIARSTKGSAHAVQATASTTSRSMQVVRDEPSVPTSRRKSASNGSDAEIRLPGWRRVLAVLKQYGPRSRSEIGVLAVMVASVGSFGNILRDLRGKGQIVQACDGKWEITQLGVEESGDDLVPTGRDLVAAWRRRFGEGAAGKMFDAYAEAGAAGLTRPELGAKTVLVHSVGSFGNAMRRISSQEIVVEIERGRRAFVPLLLEAMKVRVKAGRKSKRAA